MSRAGEYLGIPADYVQCLEGLRWSEAGDAIETAAGSTFAVNQEIALFLEGFVSRRPLIHFGHTLHLLHLLKRGGTFAALRHAYESANRPARNAGAFCAVLCEDVPSLADPPQLLEVWHALMSSCYVASLGGAQPVDAPDNDVEMPPLGPLTFEKRILRALRPYSDEELNHWLRHGQGPVKEAGATVAQAAAELRPRSLAGLLASLAQRERLSGAVPFVAQLVSALTLPPRRLTHQHLPMGGYADVTTRGHPEQVLPSQLAVDELEFLRRFAHNELLYFRREDPHARLREELVVLVDQGVRTWGVVRLVLSAAFFAFGKLAERRNVPFQVATTGSDGRLTDPLEATDATLGTLLEASDLSPHPGLALEGVLEEQSETPRDVVLLTHPRSLNEADVCAAARRVNAGTRLFAVTVDDRGSVELSELRHGTPVSVARFRVDLAKGQPQPRPAKPVEPSPAIMPATPWQGDVEPIGYPFRFGLPGKILGDRFDFDSSGNWLLGACDRGMLFAMRTDGSGIEILPRGVIDGQVLLDPYAVLGVAGGFVAAGPIGNQLVAFHYDLAERVCRAHKVGTSGKERWAWHYVPKAHAIVASMGDTKIGVDLGTAEVFSNEGTSFDPLTRLRAACNLPPITGRLFTATRNHAPNDNVRQSLVCLNPDTGALTLHLAGWIDGLPNQGTKQPLDPRVEHLAAWRNFTPIADGLPALRGAQLLKACFQSSTLALFCETPRATGKWRLYVYRCPDGVLLSESHHHHKHVHFALSRDGRLLALASGGRSDSLEVRDLLNPGAPVRTMRHGKFHNNLDARLGSNALLVGVGGFKHLIRWGGDRLEHRHVTSLSKWKFPTDEVDHGAAGQGFVRVVQILNSPFQSHRFGYLSPDPSRFVALREGRLSALIDSFGQIAMFDPLWNLVCMLFVFRKQLAAWMPDGTRYGPASLTGGPETPGAAEKIARRLQQASL